MIIRDNQAFTLLMVEKKAVYDNERRGESEPVRRLQHTHNPQNRSMVTSPKTSHGSSEHTFKEDLRLRHIARRVKHLFYDCYDKRRYQLFYVQHL